jgi:16S rRNA pseudouridine516 synthase
LGGVERLDRLLARNLGCSRAEARRLIAAGEVSDQGTGQVLDDPKAERADGAAVVVEGEAMVLHQVFHAMLNKPVGYISALTDERHPVAYTLMRDAPLHGELRPVGRLDLDTTGLLLWTTDGTWLHRLTHPKYGVPRTYQAALARPFAAPGGDLVLSDGHRPDLRELTILEGPPHPALVSPPETTVHARVTIVGGAYHEVRRIFAALGSHVLGLCRVQFGRLVLPDDLPLGEHRPVRIEDV